MQDLDRDTSVAVNAISNGTIALRPPVPGDERALVAGRDEVFRRFIGEGSPSPQPSFVIELLDVSPSAIIGWIDYERGADQTWLAAAEVNVGYNVFAPYRGRGIATRAVGLLLHHLATQTEYETASVTIAETNAASLRVAERAGFIEQASHRPANRYFKRRIGCLRV